MMNIRKMFAQAATMTTGLCAGNVIYDAVAKGHIDLTSDITRGVVAGVLMLPYFAWTNRRRNDASPDPR